MKKLFTLITLIVCMVSSVGQTRAEPEMVPEVSDPIEIVNRGFFWVNDKLHTFLMNPVTIGYSYVIPRPVRYGVNNFFNNIITPFSIVNNLLQWKPDYAGEESLRFLYNSTVGVLGVLEVAEPHHFWEPHPEDIGQTLAHWGVSEIAYLNLPLLGTTSVRDLLSTFTYKSQTIERYRGEKLDAIWIAKGVHFIVINNRSLTIGQYEEIKETSPDSYTAIRDGWFKKRYSAILE